MAGEVEHQQILGRPVGEEVLDGEPDLLRRRVVQDLHLEAADRRVREHLRQRGRVLGRRDQARADPGRRTGRSRSTSATREPSMLMHPSRCACAPTASTSCCWTASLAPLSSIVSPSIVTFTVRPLPDRRNQSRTTRRPCRAPADQAGATHSALLRSRQGRALACRPAPPPRDKARPRGRRAPATPAAAASANSSSRASSEPSSTTPTRTLQLISRTSPRPPRPTIQPCAGTVAATSA